MAKSSNNPLNKETESTLVTDLFSGENATSIQCDKCSKIFKNKKTLRKHIKTHSDIKIKFECVVC